MGSDGGGTLRAALSALVDEPGAAALTTAEQAVAVRLQQQPSGAPVLQLMDEQGATLQLLPVADVEVRCFGQSRWAGCATSALETCAALQLLPLLAVSRMHAAV